MYQERLPGLLPAFLYLSRRRRNNVLSEGGPWMTPVIGGSGTSPKACMQMTWKACPAGRRCTGTVHMLTASARPVQASSYVTIRATQPTAVDSLHLHARAPQLHD